MKAQANQAVSPATRMRPDSMTAKFLPTTAMLPLSKYRNGRGGFRPLSSLEIIAPLLDCDLRHARQRLAVLHQRRRIADHEYIWSVRNTQERADTGSPRPVGRNAKHLHE